MNLDKHVIMGSGVKNKVQPPLRIPQIMQGLVVKWMLQIFKNIFHSHRKNNKNQKGTRRHELDLKNLSQPWNKKVLLSIETPLARTHFLIPNQD